jgi:hypothetical protein
VLRAKWTITSPAFVSDQFEMQNFVRFYVSFNRMSLRFDNCAILMNTKSLERTRHHAVAGAEADILRLKWLAAAARFKLALRRHNCALKYGFNPEQPRVPRGNPDGGQWTRVAASNSPRTASRGRYGANFPGATYRQQVRLDLEIARTENALRQIRQYDPAWKPSVQSLTEPGSIEGAIRNAEARAQQAEGYLDQLRTGIGGNLGPPFEARRAQSQRPISSTFDGDAWINAYRATNNMPDLFGRPSWPNDKGTVAVTEIDGKLFFGVNSGAPTYTTADQKEAGNWRGALVDKYPSELRTKNIGSVPNDSFYHAESNVLLRAARANNGTLEGRTIEVHTDREMCGPSCMKVLPKLGIELGNPRVTFIGPGGTRRTMKDGDWE